MIRLQGMKTSYKYLISTLSLNMDPSREKLKLIVRNLKLLVDALESEVYSDVDAYSNSKAFSPQIADYDEVFDDDDGYAD